MAWASRPCKRLGREKPHGRDAHATGVAPIDPLGPASLSWRWTTSARSRNDFSGTALELGSVSFHSFGAVAEGSRPTAFLEGRD